MASSAKRPELIAIARDLAGVPMSDDYEKMISGMLYVLTPGRHFNLMAYKSQRNTIHYSKGACLTCYVP
jgi:hypothetical protein